MYLLPLLDTFNEPEISIPMQAEVILALYAGSHGPLAELAKCNQNFSVDPQLDSPEMMAIYDHTVVFDIHRQAFVAS